MGKKSTSQTSIKKSSVLEDIPPVVYTWLNDKFTNIQSDISAEEVQIFKIFLINPEASFFWKWCKKNSIPPPNIINFLNAAVKLRNISKQPRRNFNAKKYYQNQLKVLHEIRSALKKINLINECQNNLFLTTKLVYGLNYQNNSLDMKTIKTGKIDDYKMTNVSEKEFVKTLDLYINILRNLINSKIEFNKMLEKSSKGPA